MVKEPWLTRAIKPEILLTICVLFSPADTINMDAMRIAFELEKQPRASLGSRQPVTIIAAILIRLSTVRETYFVARAKHTRVTTKMTRQIVS